MEEYEIREIFQDELSAGETIYWTGAGDKRAQKKNREESIICLVIGLIFGFATALLYAKAALMGNINWLGVVLFTGIALLLIAGGIAGLIKPDIHGELYAVTNERVMIKAMRSKAVSFGGRVHARTGDYSILSIYYYQIKNKFAGHYAPQKLDEIDAAENYYNLAFKDGQILFIDCDGVPSERISAVGASAAMTLIERFIAEKNES